MNISRYKNATGKGKNDPNSARQNSILLRLENTPFIEIAWSDYKGQYQKLF